ncbi:MAG: hypothetical protein U0S48_22755 [Solirubrobacteraceae bacterium]
MLKAAEGHLDCELFLRAATSSLPDGEPEAVRAGEQVVREIADLVEQGHEIAPGDRSAP